MPTNKVQNTASAAVETAANNGDFERLLTGPISFGPRSMPEAVDFANRVAKSQLVPKDYQGKPENVFAAIQWGAEIGLSPMQALQGIAIINGRPSLWGDVMLALVMVHPDYEWHHEGGDEKAQWFEIKRRGKELYRVTFSMDDAKKAGLAGKQGPWTAYPRRMMQMRARGFALRDKFPDALKGMISREEAQDYQAEQPHQNRADAMEQQHHDRATEMAKNTRKTAQVYDASGQAVAEPINAGQLQMLTDAIRALAGIRGKTDTDVIIALDEWYAKQRDGEALPDLKDLLFSDWQWVMNRVENWLKSAKKQAAAAEQTAAEPEPETETAETAE